MDIFDQVDEFFIPFCASFTGARGGADCWGTAQSTWLRVQFPLGH